MNTFIFLLLGYMAILFAVSWFVGRNASEESFLIAGRDRVWWQILFSKFAATIGVAWFVSYTAFAYEYGWSVAALILGLMLGYLIYAFWGAPRILRFSKEGGGFYGMGDLVKFQTKNNHAETLTNAFATTAAFLWVVIPVVGAGTLMEEFGFISYELAALFTILVILLYVLSSGFKAVVATDVVQGIVVVVLLSVVSYALYGAMGSSSEQIFAVRPIDPLLVFMFLFLGAAVTFASTDRYQLSYSARDSKTIQWGMALAFIPVLIAVLLLLVIGNMMFGVDPNLDSDSAFPQAMKLFLSPELVPVMLILFFAGLMSSIDSALYASATHLLPLVRRTKITKYATQCAILGIGFVALLVSLVFKSITDIAILTTVMQVCISFAMIYLIAGKTSHYRFLALTYSGLIAMVSGLFVVGLEPTLAAFPLLGNIFGALVPTKILKRIFK